MIKISIYVGWLCIYKTILSTGIIEDIINLCTDNKCTADVFNNDFIKVTGDDTDLYRLLHELTYTYSLCLE